MTTLVASTPVLNRATPLFEKKVHTQGFTHADEIMIRVLTGKRNAGSVSEDIIHVEVTDQKDPFVMYFVDINESKLAALREQYKIVVHMVEIHDIVIKLLDQCLMGPQVKEGSSRPVTYYTRLNPDDGLFLFMEKNHYSDEVVHFRLPMQRGDDRDVQEYLASRLELSLTVASRQAASIEHLNATLKQELEEKQQALQELNDLRTMTDVRQQSSQSSHSQELSKMRMECANQKEEQRKIFEEEKTLLRDELTALIAKSQEERNAFDKERISFEKYSMETGATMRELQRKLDSEVASRERMEKEWLVTSDKKGEIESLYVNIQGEKAQLDARVKLLTEQLTSKVETIGNQQKLLGSSENACRKVEERLSEVQATLADTQRHLADSQDQCAEQAALIAKLEDRLSKHAERLKMKDETLRRQEVVVNEFREKFNTAQQALVEAREREKTKQIELQGEKRNHEETSAQLARSNQKVEDDQRTIAFLNEQINQHQLTGGYLPTTAASSHHLSYTPHTTPGVHAVTPSAYPPRSQPRTGGTASDASYTPHATYDFLSAGAGVSPETNFTAPYASSARAGTSVPITSSSSGYAASSSAAAAITTTATTDYVRKSSYTHQHHVQAANKSFSSQAESFVQNANRLGIVDDVYDSNYFADLARESPSHSEESSGSSGSAARRMAGVRSSAGLSAAAGGVSGGKSVGKIGSNNPNELNLDDLAFYSLPSEKRATTPGSGASPPHKTSRLPVRAGATTTTPTTKALYEWQDPDYGKF